MGQGRKAIRSPVNISLSVNIPLSEQGTPAPFNHSTSNFLQEDVRSSFHICFMGDDHGGDGLDQGHPQSENWTTEPAHSRAGRSNPIHQGRDCGVSKSAFLTEEGYLWKNILFILSGERLGTWWWFADAEKRSSAGLDGSKALLARFLPPWVRDGERRGLGRREDGPWGCLVWVGRTRKNEKNIIGGYLGKRVILRW